jgi:hypothetical protein
MPVEVENYLETGNGLALGMVIAPVAGLVAAGAAAYRSIKGEPTEIGERVVARAAAQAEQGEPAAQERAHSEPAPEHEGGDDEQG